MATSATSKTFPLPALQTALSASIANGTFADTAYYLYAGKIQRDKIGKPRAVFANSEVMKAAAPYFNIRKLIRCTGDFQFYDSRYRLQRRYCQGPEH